jgi:hypothetical protein
MALVVGDFFTVLGKYVKTTNVFDGLLATIDTGQTDIENILESNNLTRLFGNIPALFTGYKSNVVLWMERTNALASEFITDRDYVREQIPVQGDDLNSILLALIKYMNDQGTPDTVLKSVVTVATVDVTGISSSTAGDLIVDKTLDGVTPPVTGGLASREYKGLESQMSVPSDTIYAECKTKVEDGQESWDLYSTAAATPGYQIQDEASGPGPTIKTANAQVGAISIANGDLEVFSTTDVPDGWTMIGTVGSGYSENNAATFVFRGSSSLQVDDSGTEMKQQIVGLAHEKMYMFSCQVARDSTDVGTMDVTLTVEDSAGSTEYFTNSGVAVVVPSLGDEFIVVNLFFYIDGSVDLNDVYINIAVDNFLTSPTLPLYIDEVLVTAPVYYNGVNFSILRGASEFQVGDRFSVAITNNQAGVFQNYFRKAYGIQLPTDTSPSETVDDTLATA